MDIEEGRLESSTTLSYLPEEFKISREAHAHDMEFRKENQEIDDIINTDSRTLDTYHSIEHLQRFSRHEFFP